MNGLTHSWSEKAAVWIGVWLIVNLTLVALWDLHQSTTGANEATVSAVLRGWSKAWPVLPAAIGFLMGHLLWP